MIKQEVEGQIQRIAIIYGLVCVEKQWFTVRDGSGAKRGRHQVGVGLHTGQAAIHTNIYI